MGHVTKRGCTLKKHGFSTRTGLPQERSIRTLTSNRELSIRGHGGYGSRLEKVYKQLGIQQSYRPKS